MNDAQQSLNSLLNPQHDDTQPRIISQSGAIRNQTRGRVAAPGASSNSAGSLKSHAPGAGMLIEGGEAKTDSDRLLTIVPGTHPLYDDDDVHYAPPSRVQVGLARASAQVLAVRERANLLLGSPDASAMGLDEAALHTSRRAAAQWVSRYATHLVILAIVLALVGFGGLKTLTVAGGPNGLQSADAYNGTDAFGNGAGNNDASESQNYSITLPRTELGGADAANNSRVIQPDAGSGQNPGPQQAPVRTTVTAYTVVQGDTIQSVADKFQVMPETVMGSNGLYDSQAALTVGSVLNIPPIDGMYYVPSAKDTLDTISRRFQVDPEVVKEYQANNMADGVVKPGQPIVVPGGMMPQREVTIVYTVQPGDSLKDIAARYGVDVPTMLGSNDIPNPDALQIGTQLKVLPVAGMEYKVRKGDTITSIAQMLGVTTQNILDYSPNNLSADSTLQVDQTILVPGGSPAAVEAAVPPVIEAARVAPVSRGAAPPASNKPLSSVKPPTQPQSNVQPPAQPQTQPKAPPVAPAQPQNPSSYRGGGGALMWPVNGVITQYFSSHHNGLDIAIAAGTPIHAADSGRIIWSGWRTDGLGYCVIIDHLDGLVTVYGHQIKQPIVYVGQYVTKGQIIGYIGSTGHSTGPHVHFMVKVGTGANYRNPLAYLGSR